MGQEARAICAWIMPVDVAGPFNSVVLKFMIIPVVAILKLAKSQATVFEGNG